MTRPIPSGLLVLAAKQYGLISTRQADQFGIHGGKRQRLCTAGTWARVCRGVYDVEPRADIPFDRRRRRAAVVGLLRYEGAVAVGQSALALIGAEGLPIRRRCDVMIPGSQARVPLRDLPVGGARAEVSVAVRQFEPGARTVTVDGFDVVAPEYALSQAVPELQHCSAVAVMDSMIRKQVIDDAGLARAHRLARGRRGVARTHMWWSEVDGRSESVIESHARVECNEFGVPPDELQVEIRDPRGCLLGRADLGWRLPDGSWLLVEIDGREFHDTPGALLHDRTRQNGLVIDGEVHVLRFTAEDLGRDDGYFVVTIRRALMRLGRVAA